MAPAFGLDGGLPQKRFGLCKGGKKLVVKVVPVGYNDDGRVVHGQHKFAGVENHKKALARPLGMPYYAYLPVAVFGDRPPGTIYRLVHRVVLVVPRQYFYRFPAVGLEQYKVLYNIKEPLFFKHSFYKHFKLRDISGCNVLPVYGPPHHKPFLVGRQGAGPGVNPVTYYHE